MKSQVISEPSSPLTFPRLMKSRFNNLIVLFNSRNSGMVVHPASQVNKMGSFYSSWGISTFEDYRGSVILSND